MAFSDFKTLLKNSLSILDVDSESENTPPFPTIVTEVQYSESDEDPTESRLLLHGVGKIFTTDEVKVDEEAKTVTFMAFGDEYVVRPLTNDDKEKMSPELREEVEELERQVNSDGE